MATKVKVKVNAGGVGYSLPNPIPNQPPLTAAAYRGDVVEMPAEEAERLKNVRVRVFYDDPVTGVRLGAFREEPAVVDATEDEAEDFDAVEATRSKIRELEDQLAAERNKLPLTQGTTTAVAPITAAVASTEPRNLDAPLPGTATAEAEAEASRAKPRK